MHRPRFDDCIREHLNGPTLAQKKTGTRRNERQAIVRWTGYLGSGRVDKITPTLIHGFREKRLTGGASARTVNLDTVALRNGLKFAVERGLIERLPEVRQLKQKPSPKRALLTREQLARLIGAVTGDTTRNSTLFGHYLCFFALSGAREQEFLAMRWADVGFERETVNIGSGGASKNHRSRTIDFTPDLASLVREMAGVRNPESFWLLSSPQRGARDVRAKTLRESLKMV